MRMCYPLAVLFISLSLLGTGSEAFTPLTRVIIGGLTVSALVTVFVVPAACLLMDHKQSRENPPALGTEAQ